MKLITALLICMSWLPQTLLTWLQVIAASITSNDQSAIHQQIIKLQNEVERLLV